LKQLYHFAPTPILADDRWYFGPDRIDEDERQNRGGKTSG
jgi:hypothetical protein